METVPSISQDCDNFKSYHIFKKPGRKKKIKQAGQELIPGQYSASISWVSTM